MTELMDPRHVEAVLDAADVIQIGARNMQNFMLLAEVGRADKPVLLKRGPSASVEELLMAAEYVAQARATSGSSCASAGSRPSSRRRATRSTSARSPC